jgi:hypothetical protein
MYAVFTVVTFTSGTSEEEARKGLESELIPAIKQAPGFVKGLWFGDDQQGHGLVLFDTEEQAQQAVQAIGSGSNAVGAPVASSKVYPVYAQA